MLRGLRKASANWLGKVVMGAVVGILVVSFAIWGIGDIFRGFGRATVAKVGGTEIGFEQFRQIYNDRLQQLGARVGRPISSDQARSLGLDRQILAQVISETALDERTRQLGLGVADSEVARQIQDIPAFHGPGGRFDRTVFEQRIRAAGFTEPRFIAEQRRGMVRNHLTLSVSAVPEVPRTVLDALNRFQSERRSIEYLALDRAQAGDIPQPTPEEVASYFAIHKALFRAPEYRKLTVLSLTQTDVAKWMVISDAEAKQAYDERRARYVTPGRRQVQQIVFPSQEEAKAAKEKIDSGVAFDALARERGLSEKDIDLGFVARSAALTPALQEAVFSLPEGAVSAPVQSRTGFALVKVLKIEPDRTRSFEEAAAEIKQELARERTRSEINQKHDKIEDERAAGQTLTEVAQKLGLTVATIEAVDRSGRGPDGAPVLGLPPEVDVLAQAFGIDIGVEADPIRLADGGYVWFEVGGITRSRERDLDEVRAQVEARWLDEQVGARLKAKAGEIVDKIKAGGSFAEVAASEGLQVETAADLQRNRPDEKIPPSAVTAVFRTPKGSVDAVEGLTPAERIVFRVTEVAVPALDPGAPQAKELQESVRNSLQTDLLGQYVAQVERDLGTTINQDALRRLSGGGQADF